MAGAHTLSLSTVFIMVAVEAAVFGTLGLSAFDPLIGEPHVH